MESTAHTLINPMNASYIKYEKPMRDRRVARGLTARGTKRINRFHPELHGLILKDYHRRFMQEWRREQ